MRIESSSISMEASREYKKTETSNTMTQLFVSQPIQVDTIQLSHEGLDLAEHETTQTHAYDSVQEIDELEEELEHYLSERERLKLRLLEELISWLTGKSFKFDKIGKDLSKAQRQEQPNIRPSPAINVSANKTFETEEKSTEQNLSKNISGEGPPVVMTENQVTGNQSQGQPLLNWGLRFHHSETKTESESISFKANGKVKSSDGREIDFDLNLHMSRESFEHRSIDIQMGQTLIDPIVIQTDHIPPGLADEKIQFDLDLDGKLDNMSVPQEGSGFLVFDRNLNGIIDDGSELFGPASGHGFTELRALDSDNNGWIDENDDAFDNLQIWSMDTSGEMVLTGLIEADVGAIYLSTVSTEYQLSNSEHEQNGQLRESGIFMKESGGVSSIHEVDILV